MAENKKEVTQKEQEKKNKANEERTEEKDEGQGEEGGKKGLPLKWIVIAAVVLALGAGGFLAWKKMAAPKEDKAGKGQVVAVTDKDKGKPEMGPTYPMETFIVNLQEPSGKRYLKIQMVLEMDNESLKQEIDRRMPQFKDGIIALLSSKAYADVATLEGKMQLRAELIAMFNQYLKTGKISNAYFMDFIIQ